MRRGRFGVIGVGNWGENHVRAYTQNPRSELVAISDVNEGRARNIGSQYGVNYYTDYRRCSQTGR